MRNSSFIYLAIGTILLGLTNCKEKTSTNNIANNEYIQNSNSKKLRWLGHWMGEGKKEFLIREIARDFGFLHQDLEVELEFPQEMLGTSDNYYNLLIDSIVGMVRTGNWPYDMIFCSSYIYQQVGIRLNNPDWGKENLVDFKNEIWLIKAHKKSVFEKNTYTRLTSDMVIGNYLEGGWNILYGSEIVAKKLGIEIKSFDMDIDDFVSYAKAVYEYNLANPMDKITFFSLIRGRFAHDFLFWQLTMSALGKDQPTSTEEALYAVKQAYDALEKLAPYKPLEQNDTYENDLQLNADKALFIFYYSYISLLWKKNNPEAEKMMFPCEIPSLKGKKATMYPGQYSVVFAIPKKSNNPEAAKKLMNFIASTEIADKWTKYAKSPTGLRNRISYNDFGTDKYGKFARHIKQKYNDRLNEENLGVILFNAQQEIFFNVDLVLKGEMTADEAYNNLLNQLDLEQQ